MRKMFSAICPTGEGNYKQPRSPKLPEKVAHDISITVSQQGDWTVAIPQEAEIVSENQAPKSKQGVVALDPGVRVFQSLFTPDGYVMEWGTKNLCINILNNFHHNHSNMCISGRGDDKVHLERLRHHADRLREKMNEVKGQRRRRRRRALLKLNQRIRVSAFNKFKIKYVEVMCVLVCIFIFVQNKVKEIHFQLANYLAKNFRQVLIRALPVAEFVKRETRKLGKKIKNMLAWSHYAFRQRLKNTVRRHPWCEVCLFVLYEYMYVR